MRIEEFRDLQGVMRMEEFRDLGVKDFKKLRNLWRKGIGEIMEGFGELTLRNWKVK